MNILRTESFKKDFQNLPAKIKQKLEKAITFLIENSRYPSLRAKKLPGTEIWYARVDHVYRFTFRFNEGSIVLRRVGTHDVLDRERRK